MCHLILFMPVLALPVFWLMPLNFAAPIYAVIALLSGFLYWLIHRALREPVQDGFRSLIGTEARVVSKQEQGHSARYLVQPQNAGELWSAYSTDILDIGDWVNIVAVRGIGVVVEQAGNSNNGTGKAKNKLTG